MDWGQRIQDLAAGAGQVYTRSLRRYNELLERVARGELRPEQVQQGLREYFQAHSAASTRDMVATSAGLLADLLHLEARYRDSLLDGLLPAEPPTPPPPSPAGVDPTQWFQALASYAAAQGSRSLARQQRLIDRVAAGEIPAAAVHEHGRRFLETQAPQFLSDVMALGLRFIEQLQGASASATDGLYDVILGPERPAESPRTDGLAPPVCLELRAAPGGVASASLVVENTRAAPAEVVCRVSEFVSRVGSAHVRPTVDISPSRFTLAPGEQRDVDLRLVLDRVQFATGTDYIATLLVSGTGERELVVHLLARAEAEPRVAQEPSSDGTGPSASARAAKATAPRHATTTRAKRRGASNAQSHRPRR